jgi:hypothetical protein
MSAWRTAGMQSARAMPGRADGLLPVWALLQVIDREVVTAEEGPNQAPFQGKEHVMTTMFWENADIKQLAGDHAPLVNFMHYNEEGGTRNYCVEFHRDRFGHSGDGLWYWVHIQLIDSVANGVDQDHVEVTVTADWRQSREIASFAVPTEHNPSPISLDPAVIQRAIEFMLSDIRRELGNRRSRA